MKNSFGHRVGGLIRLCFCGVLTGVFTAVVILLYKVCAGAAVLLSHFGYTYLRGHLYLLPAVFVALFGIAKVVAYVCRKWRYIQGGGIPTSIGVLCGFISLDWRKSMIGTFLLSVLIFVLGVPLGNEGPSVQMGTAVGKGVVSMFPKSQRVLDRYAMTGGACAGFSSATGAPISGILFAIEEAHGKFSPLILLVSATAVLSARATIEWLAPVFGVGVSLFPQMSLAILSVYDLWLPLLVGAVIGLFSVVFLKYYDMLYGILRSLRHKIGYPMLIFAIFVATLGAGLCSFEYVSTGHELILGLFGDAKYVLPLLIILVVRTTLGLGANASGVTGGVFVPILALGALVSAVLAVVLRFAIGLSAEYSLLVILLGIAACVAGTMKMPLTAVTFAVEALSCHNNLLPVVTVTITAFAVTELFGVHSINERVLERKLKSIYEDKTFEECNEFVTVKPNSFAEGKKIRDMLWPGNLFIMSVMKNSEVAEEGQVKDMVLEAGDVLHIRYSAFDKKETQMQLAAIIGEGT